MVPSKSARLAVCILSSVGLAITLCMLGFYLGHLVPWQGENGFFDLREMPKAVASLGFGFLGLVLGGICGFLLAKKLPTPYSVVLAVLTMAIPICATAAMFISRQHAEERQVAFRAKQAEEHRQKEIQYQKEHQAYLQSPAYASQIAQEAMRLQDFKSHLDALVYPRAALIGTDEKGTSFLEYSTPDDAAQVDAYFSKVPQVSIGYRSPTPERTRGSYFNKDGYRGEIRIKTTESGTTITYFLDPA